MSESYSKNSGLKTFAHDGNWTNHFVDLRPFPPQFSDGSASSPLTVHFQVSPRATGSKNPLWRYQTRHLQNATTSFEGLDYSDDPRPFITIEVGVRYRRLSDNKTVESHAVQWQTGSTAVTTPVYVDAPISVVADVTNRCIRDFLRSVDSAQSSFETGQDLGEWRQTVEAIHHPLNTLKNSIVNYLGALRKRRSKYNNNPATLRKILADTYLEFHFGWQPLVADVASLIADIGRFRFPVIPVHGRAHKDYASTETTIHGGIFGPLEFTHSYKETSRYEVRYKGMLRPKHLGSDGRLSALQALQLTPDKWLPTAWDLLPYSWMSDYFVNIGEIISGLSASLSIDLPWGVITARNKITRHYRDVDYSDPNQPWDGYTMDWHIFTVLGGSCETWAKRVNRNALSGSDLIPTLELNFPISKYPFFNIAAVLAQASVGLTPYYRK